MIKLILANGDKESSWVSVELDGKSPFSQYNSTYEHVIVVMLSKKY